MIVCSILTYIKRASRMPEMLQDSDEMISRQFFISITALPECSVATSTILTCKA